MKTCLQFVHVYASACGRASVQVHILGEKDTHNEGPLLIARARELTHTHTRTNPRKHARTHADKSTQRDMRCHVGTGQEGNQKRERPSFQAHSFRWRKRACRLISLLFPTPRRAHLLRVQHAGSPCPLQPGQRESQAASTHLKPRSFAVLDTDPAATDCSQRLQPARCRRKKPMGGRWKTRARHGSNGSGCRLMAFGFAMSACSC